MLHPRGRLNLFCAEIGWHALEPTRHEWSKIQADQRTQLLEHCELRQYARDAQELLVVARFGDEKSVRGLGGSEFRPTDDDIFTTESVRVVSWTRQLPLMKELRRRHSPCEKRAWIRVELNRSLDAHVLMEAARKGLYAEIADKLVSILYSKDNEVTKAQIPDELHEPRYDTAGFCAWLAGAKSLPWDWDRLSGQAVEDRLLDLCCYQCAQTGNTNTSETHRPHRDAAPDDLLSRALKISEDEFIIRTRRVHEKMMTVWSELLDPQELRVAVVGGYIRVPYFLRTDVPCYDKLPESEPGKFLSVEKAAAMAVMHAGEETGRRTISLIVSRAIHRLFVASERALRREIVDDIALLARVETSGESELTRYMKASLGNANAPHHVILDVTSFAHEIVVWVNGGDSDKETVSRLNRILECVRKNQVFMNALTLPVDTLNLTAKNAADKIPRMLRDIFKDAQQLQS